MICNIMIDGVPAEEFEKSQRNKNVHRKPTEKEKRFVFAALDSHETSRLSILKKAGFKVSSEQKAEEVYSEILSRPHIAEIVAKELKRRGSAILEMIKVQDLLREQAMENISEGTWSPIEAALSVERKGIALPVGLKKLLHSPEAGPYYCIRSK